MNKKRWNVLSGILFVMFFTAGPHIVSAEENSREYAQTKYGISLTGGNTYNLTDTISYYMVSGIVLFDYDKVWKHKAPEQLRFKVEGSIGAARDKKTRLVSSMNIFAHYYLDFLVSQNIRPFVEGGVGIIYTDFQVRGQGLRINFNPQFGLGAEFNAGMDNTFFFSVRIHHISNGGLDHENRGINSVMGVLGYYF